MTDRKIDFSRIARNPDLEYEYESRLKVDTIAFNIIHARVSKLYPISSVSVKRTTDYYVEEDEYRYTTDNNMTFTKIQKKQIRSVKNKDIKYSLSSEKTEETLSMILSEDKRSLLGSTGTVLTVKSIRKKNRIAYPVDNVVIHLTEVRNADNVITSLEVEVEANPFKDDFD